VHSCGVLQVFGYYAVSPCGDPETGIGEEIGVGEDFYSRASLKMLC